ncbi:MAG: HNH endonuclease [Chloroflexota bacterium]|nr:HNH endonuclease [Chloroflexota bacterium]
MTNAQMKAQLVERNGIVCAGCDRRFDDERYLQLDHNAPRSQGGLHHISNRLLLCGPCNLAKSNTLTLEGLRRHNRANGWMAKA